MPQAHTCGILLFCGIYFAMFSQKRMRIVATCARVAEPAGDSVVALVPEIRPEAFAQAMASVA